jgi:nucleotide-binding universal stress UspA family protein
MFKNILVPTDGSQLCQDSARSAISFAKDAGARVCAFYAKPEYPVTYYGEGALIDPTTPEQFAELADQQARENLSYIEQICADAGVPCSTVTVTSDVPYEAIIETANERGCDLIYMASHARRGLAHFFLGNETDKVLTHTKIPVLVFR